LPRNPDVGAQRRARRRNIPDYLLDFERSAADRLRGAMTDSAPELVEMGASQISRRVCHILRSAADRLGVPHDEGAHFEDQARAIVMAAQVDRAKLAPQEYRSVYGIWQIFRRYRTRLQ
jgi:hypothetical protein